MKRWFTLSVLGLLQLCAFARLNVQDLRCEYLKDPQGVDVARPRLSWVLQATTTARNQAQSAYQVVVASSPKLLDSSRPDLWDSGKVVSDQSIQVTYGGRPLRSQQQCFWKIRVWDQDGRRSGWSEPARWSMGLLEAGAWTAKWIGKEETERDPSFTGTFWIWFPEGHPEKSAPVATRYFRKSFELPADRQLKSAHWMLTGDNQFVAYVNGKAVGRGSDYRRAADLEVAKLLKPGLNTLAVSVENTGESPNPAGVAALLRVEFDSGKPFVIRSDEEWRTSAEELAGWMQADYSDDSWLPARKLGEVGMQPWGEVSGPENRRLPARWLRKEFQLDKKIQRATAFFSGLGLSELYINGRKVSDDVLSPGLTEYGKRVFYVTRDITGQLKLGSNAVGVILGNGRFFPPRGKIPDGVRAYGYPRMLLQIQIEYAEGSSETIVSDDSWKLTTSGPILANNEYDGEEYDARQEMPGWAEPGFKDTGWSAAELVGAPAGRLSAQMIAPIRVTQTLKPVGVTEIKPGVYIFDMGQNMVGWCRLHVSGTRGVAVTLRHAETLRADGTLYLENLRSAQVTDTYTLKGEGNEVYEPRFTYHGFRYVEVTGYPGTPDLSALEGRVVHDSLEPAGQFACSNDLLNRIYRNVVWGVRGNYRSIPTDCPQRDERQGWLGDRSAESKGETYLFNTAALYSKWLQDMDDAQKESGSVSDVCPSYWQIYSDNVTWPSSTVIIPGALRDQYADTAIIARHYDSAKLWFDYMGRFVTNGIIARDSYGDWCMPPEDPVLIHSKDPARMTDRSLIATAYFYHDANLLSGYARLLCKPEDAARFAEMSRQFKAAFNDKFYNAASGYYANGSQTACVLPLAFGLVPDGQRERVFKHLVDKIANESHGHIGTGLIGGQWLMRVLTGNGRPDLAYTIATQKTYPSWGYMVERGATTIWELWNGDTADPAMNSGNHVMLVGDLVIWANENLAGIKPDPEQPGFKHLLMRPEPVSGLSYVKASHRSLFGQISSEWKVEKGVFGWDVTIPPNTTATVLVPCTDLKTLTESGKAPAKRGLRIISHEKDRAGLNIGSGTYHFESR